MIIIHLIAIVSIVIYLVSLIIFRWGLNHPRPQRTADLPTISIVIAVKNEAVNLPRLIEHLTGQHYPDGKLEIIVVDNDSTDETWAILQNEAARISNLRIFTTRTEGTPYHHKKAALAVGIREARGEVILTTDADCSMGKDWARTMASYFTEDVGIVVGFSAIRYLNDWFSRLQALDYLQLMAAAQGSTNLGLAWACSGSNWAFRKVLFENAGGYMLVRDRVGGDDSLFMQVMQKRTRTKVVFAADEAAWVETQAADSLATFLRQRIRWASEANYMHHFNCLFFVVILATFLANLMPIVYFVLAITGVVTFVPFLIVIAIKLIGEAMLAFKAVRVYQRKDLMGVFIPWFIIQPFYIVLMGILSFGGNRLDWGHRSSSHDSVK
jgi:cellulose synthase/poly-beta-1,6-N-acetylglucosamine synthase-like glycosyltransferase